MINEKIIQSVLHTAAVIIYTVDILSGSKPFINIHEFWSFFWSTSNVDYCIL